MKTRVLIITLSAVIVASVLIGLTYESKHNYEKWNFPLSKINQEEIFFLDDAHQGGYDSIFFPTIKNVSYINNDSIEITFHKSNYTDFIPTDFEFTTVAQRGDKFIVMCMGNTFKGVSYSTIAHLVEVNSTFVSFHHYEADLPKEVECKYPEIIKHSFNVKWKEFDKNNKPPL